MSRLRALVAFVVCALTPFAAADVQLRSSPIISCGECYGRWADFNGDGLDDFLVRNRLYLNLGGRLASPMELQDFGYSFDEVSRVADVNRDGFADIFLSAPGYSDGAGNEFPERPMRLLVGDGAGRFSDRPMPGGAGFLQDVEDYTGDGIPDILRWDFPNKDLVILRGNGDATFTQHEVIQWPFEQAYYGFTPADVNGDGRLDLVAPNDDYLTFLIAQPDGKFGDVQARFTRTHLQGAKFADVNGDGKADLVFNDGHHDAGITVLVGDGAGRFPGVVRYAVPGSQPGGGGGASEIQVGDFIAGGSNEIAFGGAGFVAIVGFANGQLAELARIDVEPNFPLVRVVRFSANKPQITALGQWYNASAPVGRRSDWVNWLIEIEGAATAPVSISARRRGRAIGRNAFTGGRYHVALEGDCPLTSLREWKLEREGMFVDVERSPVIERAESAFIDGQVFMRLHVKDGATTRILEGTLNVTDLGLSGKLFEWGDSPCGGRWQVHRVTATLSH